MCLYIVISIYNMESVFNVSKFLKVIFFMFWYNLFYYRVAEDQRDLLTIFCIADLTDMPKKSAEWRCNSPQIQSLILARNWKQLDDFHKIKEIYDFVRNEIKFGYNVNDSVTATQVLKDGYGQCNTKGTLFMALPSISCFKNIFSL